MTKVFMSGVWDLFHTGHLDFIQFGKSRGDYLIVSVASDATVRALKREPIINEYDRLRIVQAIKYVDEAFISRGEHSNLDCIPYVELYKPDVWVVNEDDKIIPQKQEIADKLGIKLIVRERLAQNPSTTTLIQEIATR